MKPKSIRREEILADTTLQSKKMSLETPIGTIESDSGNHYLDINLTDSHTVDVTQDGSGSHSAKIHLSGNPSSVTLTQDSSSNQNYHLEQNCSSSSCSATVTQN